MSRTATISRATADDGPKNREGPSAASGGKITINLPEKTYQDLALLAIETDTTMKEIVREALGVVAVAAEEARNGNRLAIVNKDGSKVLHQIVLVRYEGLFTEANRGEPEVPGK